MDFVEHPADELTSSTLQNNNNNIDSIDNNNNNLARNNTYDETAQDNEDSRGEYTICNTADINIDELNCNNQYSNSSVNDNNTISRSLSFVDLLKNAEEDTLL